MQTSFEARRRRVLIVEDDAAVLELITTRLVLAGFQTFYAQNGREGLNCLDAVRPEVLVLDINMPVMDGFAVLAHLNARRGFFPPTLILTARNRPEDVKQALSLGARDYLAKPFKDDQPLARVERLIRRRPEPTHAPVLTTPLARPEQLGAPSEARTKGPPLVLGREEPLKI